MERAITTKASKTTERPSRTYKISGPNGKSAKPIYIYKFSVIKEDNKKEYIWDWIRGRLAEEAVKGLIRDLKPDSDLFVIDSRENMLYALFDIFTTESTVQSDDLPCVIAKVKLDIRTLKKLFLSAAPSPLIEGTHTVKFRKVGSPITDLHECASRPEVQRAINCLLLTDIKRATDNTIVEHTEENVGRVFKIESDKSDEEKVEINEINSHARSCCGLAASIHQVPTSSPSGKLGLELKLTQDFGCFYGSGEWLAELGCQIAHRCEIPTGAYDIIRQEFKQHLIKVGMHCDDEKTITEFKDCTGKLLRIQTTYEDDEYPFPALQLPKGIRIDYEDMPSLLTPIGCLLPRGVWTPGEILFWGGFENMTLHSDVDEMKLATNNPNKQRKIYEKKCDTFVKRHCALMKEFGFKLEPNSQ